MSVVILTKNEARGIGATLSQLGDYDEVIVVDSSSCDDTVRIAERLGARVIRFVWNQSYPKKKQWALDNVDAKHNWILLLDADEYPTESLTDEIRHLFARLPPQSSAYDISLSYRFAGKFLRHGHRVTKRSLLDRRFVRFPEVDDLQAPGIREVEGHYQPQTDGAISRLQGHLCHDDQDPIASWFDRHNRYSDWEAYLRVHDSLRREIASKRTKRGLIFDGIPMKPLAFFAYGYIIRAGFLDGRAGFDYALALSMYYWQTGVKTRELLRQGDSAEQTPSHV